MGRHSQRVFHVGLCAVEAVRPHTAAPAVIREAPEPVEPKRSWKKTAIIIGAGAGSGAVVGGIIDGKKGAGIGAAIGGGAASVYEVLKRR